MESTIRGSVPAGTRLIETFGWWPDRGYDRVDMHLARMARSAHDIGFAFDHAEARACLTADGASPLRCRLTLGADGFQFATSPLAPINQSWVLAVADQRLLSGDIWLRHKSTNRTLYDDARANLPAGVDEYLFFNEKDEACEGTITNLFVTLQNDRIVTPPISSGVLPGILRQSLLEAGRVHESVVSRDMLENAKAVHMGNALRGLIRATLN